jgi:hypothetical protein
MPTAAPIDLPSWVCALRDRVKSRKLLPHDKYLLEPSRLFVDAGYQPDQWQRDLLERPHQQTLLLCSRQSGKSTVTAGIALLSAMQEPNGLILLLSRSQRQSSDLFRDKVLRLWDKLGRPLEGPAPTALTLTLSNGSRILSLPGDEETIRGYSGVRLLVIDEASRVPDALYYSVRPMLAVSKGILIALTTPYGRRGWFHAEWSNDDPDWHRVQVKADQCPRIGRDFLEKERRRLGPRWFRQEYETSFEATEDEVFSYDAVMGIIDDDVLPLWPDTQEENEGIKAMRDDLRPYTFDLDDLASPPLYAANTCRACGLARHGLDAWGKCPSCRIDLPRPAPVGTPSAGMETWGCPSCGKKWVKDRPLSRMICPCCA